MSAATLIHNAIRLLQEAGDMLGPWDITIQQFDFLQQVRRAETGRLRPQQTVRILAALFDEERRRVEDAMRRLEEGGYIAVEDDHYVTTRYGHTALGRPEDTPGGVRGRDRRMLDYVAFLEDGELYIRDYRALYSGGFDVPRYIDYLERVGYVQRRRHPEDGRAYTVDTTEDGRKALKEIIATLDRKFDQHPNPVPA